MVSLLEQHSQEDAYLAIISRLDGLRTQAAKQGLQSSGWGVSDWPGASIAARDIFLPDGHCIPLARVSSLPGLFAYYSADSHCQDRGHCFPIAIPCLDDIAS